jgi:hypothetical protein
LKSTSPNYFTAIKPAEIVKELALSGSTTQKIAIVKQLTFAKCLAKKLKSVPKAVIYALGFSATTRSTGVGKETISAQLIVRSLVVSIFVHMMPATQVVILMIAAISILAVKNAKMNLVLRPASLIKILNTQSTRVEKLNVFISASCVIDSASFLIIFIQN